MQDDRSRRRAERAATQRRRHAPGREAAGAAFVAVAALLFGGTVVIGKLLANRELPVTSMLSIRFGFAAVFLAGSLSIMRHQLRPAPGEGLRLVALGGIGYAVESACFFLALSHGRASAVTLLFFTYPVWVAVLSMIFGWGMPGWTVGGALLSALAGAAIVIGSSGDVGISGVGVAFAIASSVTFSLYLLGADVVLKRTSALAASMWVSASAAAALAAFGIAIGGGRFPAGLREWSLVATMGAFTAAAFSVLFMGLERLGAVRTSIVAALEPVAASALAVVFLGEPLRAGTIGGGVLILGAAVVASIARGGPGEPEAAVP